jgi:hypothetical protein
MFNFLTTKYPHMVTGELCQLATTCLIRSKHPETHLTELIRDLIKFNQGMQPLFGIKDSKELFEFCLAQLQQHAVTAQKLQQSVYGKTLEDMTSMAKLLMNMVQESKAQANIVVQFYYREASDVCEALKKVKNPKFVADITQLKKEWDNLKKLYENPCAPYPNAQVRESSQPRVSSANSRPQMQDLSAKRAEHKSQKRQSQERNSPVRNVLKSAMNPHLHSYMTRGEGFGAGAPPISKDKELQNPTFEEQKTKSEARKPVHQPKNYE